MPRKALRINPNNYQMAVTEDSGKYRYQEPLLCRPLDRTVAPCSSFCLSPASWTGSGVLGYKEEAEASLLQRGFPKRG